MITSVSGDSADLFTEDKSALAQMSCVDSADTNSHTHTQTYIYTCLRAVALICNSSNMQSYWPILWVAKLHNTQKPARQSLYIQPIGLAPMPVHQSDVPDADPPPQKPTNISTMDTHTNPAVIPGSYPSCLSGAQSKVALMCVRENLLT